MFIVGKKKTEEKKEEDKSFDINKALETVNPFMLDGFKWFIIDKDIKNQKEFNKLLKEYGG